MVNGILEGGEIIAAFDPGVTTGVAKVRYKQGREFDLVVAGQIPWDDRMAQMRHVIADADILVYERFALYEDKARDQINNEFPAVQVIGSLQAFWWELGKSSDLVFIQPASERLNITIVEESHKRLMVNQRHARDAYRHARYFVLMHRAAQPLRKIGG